MDHPLQQSAVEPDSIHGSSREESIAQLNKTIRVLAFACIGSLVILCVICGLLTLTGTLVVSDLFNQVSSQLDDQFGDQIADYETNLRQEQMTENSEQQQEPGRRMSLKLFRSLRLGRLQMWSSVKHNRRG